MKAIFTGTLMVRVENCCNPLDYNDKAAGVTLAYSNGDYYYAGWLYYGTHLSIRCSDSNTMPTYADVERYGISIYNIWLDSVYACPSGKSQRLIIIRRVLS